MADTPSKKPRRGDGRVEFLSKLTQIREKIAAGVGQLTIYEELGGQASLGISYSQFNRYVGRFIAGVGNEKKGTGQIANQHTPRTTGGSSASTTHGQKRPGFQHNPNSGNDRDDLI